MTSFSTLAKLSSLHRITAGVLAVLVVSCPLHAQEYREPVKLRSGEILKPEILKGDSYTVADTVQNDGLINTYQVATKYGVLTVESTALLLKRIEELRALERMEQLKKSDLYVSALKRSAMAPVETAKGLVTKPVETAEGVATGVGRWFHNVGSAITSKDSRDDNVVESATGQARAKRQFAYEFGVDPYSPYPPLQKSLDDMAWAAVGGSMTISAALSAVPGAVGTLAMTTKTAGDMKGLVRDRSPAELALLNRQKLQGMGVPESLIETFLANPAFDPQEQTILVGELDNMGGVKDRGLFVRKAATAVDEPTAVFNRVQAQMLAAYHAKAGKATRLIDAGGVVLLEKEGGGIVGLFPLDHVVWTPAVAQKVQGVSAALKEHGAKGDHEIWLLGTVDPSAEEGLTKAGWKVTPKAGERLFGR